MAVRPKHRQDTEQPTPMVGCDKAEHVQASNTATAMGSIRRAPGRGGYAANVGLLVAAGLLAIMTAPSARWNLPEILVISALTAISDLTSVATGAGKLKVSGSFLGLMLAAVLLGGPPAARRAASLPT